MPYTKHVFISYSRRDEAVMRRVVEFLRKQGITVWVDNEKLIPGTPVWEVEIEKAIINAGAIVVLLSPDSKNSPWVRREISYAEDNEIRIFPILIAGIERVTVPIRLTTHQRIDIRQNEELGLNSLSTALLFYLEDLAATEKRAKEKAEREAAEKAAKEKAEREAAEKVAKEKAEREAAEKAAKEKAEREAAEKVAKEKAEREAAEKAAKEKAVHEAAEKVAKEKAEREAAERNVKKKNEQERERQKRKNTVFKQTYETKSFLTGLKPSKPISLPDESELNKKPKNLPK